MVCPCNPLDLFYFISGEWHTDKPLCLGVLRLTDPLRVGSTGVPGAASLPSGRCRVGLQDPQGENQGAE